MLTSERIAVIGSGITGLSSAWLLHRNGANVTLFEKEDTCGGHTLTDDTSGYPIDLGFQVYNLTTYPHLVGFLESLGVDTEPSDMSFGLSMDDGKLEWASHNLSSVFAQRGNMTNPTFLNMLREVVRFGKEAPEVLEPANNHLYKDMTLGQYLESKRYSRAFKYNYVLPMCAAVWSVPNSQVMAFPVQMLIRFWVNHHLLDLTQRPLWRVIKGRSREYVRRVVSELPDVRTGTPVLSVRRASEGSQGPVVVTTASGSEQFDAVVFATHSDITLRILGQDIDECERAILEAIPYNENDIYLHTDTALMPRLRTCWASWNFIGSSDDSDDAAVCVSYWANNLQQLGPGAPDLFVTLNPPQPPQEDKVIRRLKLAHPVFSKASYEAQAQLPTIQGHRNTYYAGAWAGYGFHEDGIKAAVAVVQKLGGVLPWEPRSCSPKVSFTDNILLNLMDKFLSVSIKTGKLRIILPNGYEKHYGDESTVQPPLAEGEEWRGRPLLKATLRVFSMDFFRKVVLRHDTGLGESYMDKDYECDSLGGLLALITANAPNFQEARGTLGPLNWIGDKLLYFAHLARPNTVEGSRKNIEEHYDAGNAMYKLFLDESMMYSSAIHQPGDSLYEAQMRKLDAIIARAGITAEHHVLEIGCGWGGFAIRAAQTTGCRITGITISKEQLAEARARVKAAGLEDKVNLIFCDYRDLQSTGTYDRVVSIETLEVAGLKHLRLYLAQTGLFTFHSVPQSSNHSGIQGAGTFDRVVSIEMIEAVGHEHLRPYFAQIGRVLKPGGRAVIQAITMPDERYDIYCKSPDFIKTHIFPGGHLPSIGAMVESCRGTGLSMTDMHDIGPDYAVTLREWRKAWEERKDEVLKLGYSDKFWRKYRFYFVYCEAAFDAKYIHNYHITFDKDASAPSQPSLPASEFRPAAALAKELPTDPVTQVLLGLYFFLAGMLVHSHRVLWLMPAMFCCAAAASGAVDLASKSLVPAYRSLTAEKQAWWCADVVHMIYSIMASLAGLWYVIRQPRSLSLTAPPEDRTEPTIIAAACTGFLAFHLWVCVRSRLYTRTRRAITQYTVLLLLVGIAAVKGMGVSLLAAIMVTDVATLPFLAGKLLEMSGHPSNSKALASCRKLEFGLLTSFRVLPHFLALLAVLVTPYTAFGSLGYWSLCLAGAGHCNFMNWHRLKQLRSAPAEKLHAQ